MQQLKEQLNFGRPDAFVLRRDKRELTDLPQKLEHRLSCSLSEEQRKRHVDLVGKVGRGGGSSHPLAIIQQLMRLYQHPSLIPKYDPPTPGQAVDDCPKLKAVLQCLHKVRQKREKALVFTRTLDMQQLLAMTLKNEFGLDANIINGATSRKGLRGDGNQTRRGIISRFRESPGFNVLILSPDVAGMGLTLTEANHVIHYGRWWNPAKEAQATDRVYRIGQNKDVHVYYPIATDPKGAFETFDEKLDALITRRRELAEDFLAPMAAESDLERELLQSVLDTSTIAETKNSS